MHLPSSVYHYVSQSDLFALCRNDRNAKKEYPSGQHTAQRKQYSH